MRRSTRRSLLGARGLAVAALVLCGAGRAHAQSDAAAQALFDEAKALMAKGKNAEACPKLEESQRLDPGLGTLFNLAECLEKTGRIATAWSRYVEVAAGARSAGRADAERVAQGRANALAPRLPKLVIEVSSAENPPGFEVLRDEVRVGAAQYGVAIPVDPGSHRVSARAPGRKTWEATVSAVESQQARLTIPALELAPGAPGGSGGSLQAGDPAPVEGSEGGSSQRTLGLVIGGVGIAGIGAGLVFGALAGKQYDDASCPNNVCTTAAGEERDGAWTKATVATIAVGVGAAALAGGAILFFTAPKRDKQTSLRVTSLGLGITPGGVFVRGNL